MTSIACFAQWWAAIAVLGLVGRPLAGIVCGGTERDAAAFARPLALALWTWGSWFLASVAPISVGAAAAVAFAAICAASIAVRRSDAAAVAWSPGEEALFVVPFAAFAAIRSLEPAIEGAEKFMDFAWLNAAIRSTGLPLEDPWLAGEPAHYYTGGYFTWGLLARWAHVPPDFAYSLAVATIPAFAFHGAWALGRRATRSVWGGIAAATALALAGNAHTLVHWLDAGGSLAGFDFWKASRVVEHAITEFPFFTFLHGDLHPHLMAMTIHLPLLGIGAGIVLGGTADRRTLVARAVAAALLLSLLVVTNPWDVPAFAGWLGLAALGAAIHRGAPGRRWLIPASTAAAIAAAPILSLPFLLSYSPPTGGIGWARASTTPGEIATAFGTIAAAPLLFAAVRISEAMPRDPQARDFLSAAGAAALVALWIAWPGGWTLFFAVILTAVGLEAALRSGAPEGRLGGSLLAVGAGLVAACEVVYLKDSYGDALHRMNTIFKFYFQAWILLAIATPLLLRRAIAQPSPGRRRRAVAVSLTGALLAAGLLYPWAAVGKRVAATSIDRWTLDGGAPLRKRHPDDFAAIEWLRGSASGRPVIAEATGPAYSYFARVSSHTGLPTILGWENHQSVWRGGSPELGRRRAAVKGLYARESSGAAIEEIVDRYDVRYVFVGELETREFGEGTADHLLETLPRLAEAFRSGETRVLEVRP